MPQWIDENQKNKNPKTKTMKQMFNEVLNFAIESIYLIVGLSLILNFFRSQKARLKKRLVKKSTVIIENPIDTPAVTREKPVFKIKQFQITKLGNSEEEYEDYAQVSSENDSFLRVAVADGATESLFSDIWAKLIVEKFIENGSLETSQLQQVYQSFIEETNSRIENAPEMRRWTMYNKMERGTHATIAAIEFLNSESFRITTLGDSCVFYGENNSEIKMLPELSPEDFGNSPQLICHLPPTWEGLKNKWIKQEVTLEGAFKILLCTDALACWLTQSLPKDPTVWEKLFKLDSQESFTNLINDLRSQQVLKNDDVTLVTIDVLSIHV